MEKPSRMEGLGVRPRGPGLGHNVPEAREDEAEAGDGQRPAVGRRDAGAKEMASERPDGSE